MNELRDLETRLRKAAAVMSDLIALSDRDRQRLRGKREGIELALSYLEEIKRNQNQKF